jgi:hypothetical protein
LRKDFLCKKRNCGLFCIALAIPNEKTMTAIFVDFIKSE